MTVAPPNGKRVAIVGSGPAGLTAAWQLALARLRRQDLRGGARARRLPAPRHPGLPAAGRGRRQGHQERHRHRRRDRHEQPRAGPRRAPRATASTRSSWRPARRDRRASASPARRVAGVLGGVEFLRDVRLDRAADLAGQAGRRRRRRQRGDGRGADRAAPGRCRVTVAYRRGREEMPAHRAEIDDAEREGVRFAFLAAPVEVVADEARRRARPALHEDGPRCAGRVRPTAARADRRQRVTLDCDVVIAAIGMAADTRAVRGPRPDQRERHARGRPGHAADGVRRHLRGGRRRHRARRTSLAPSARAGGRPS